MLEWLKAFTAGSDLVTKILNRLWGDQTREEASSDRDADRLEREFLEASARGDVDTANAVRARLLQLRDKAAARRG